MLTMTNKAIEAFKAFRYNEKQYLELCRHVLEHGTKKTDRTGTGTISYFGYQMRFDMRLGFPLLTTKYIDYKKVLGELLAFIHGETNADVIGDKYGFKIWKLWQKDESGDLGPIYGRQWRSWPAGIEYHNDDEYPRMKYIDQLQEVIDEIKNNPDSRRLIVNAWNVAELPNMALPPCHLLFQFYVADGKLSLQLYQRSADIFLGVPYNIASYATLLHIVANLTGLEPGEFIHTIGDAHIYLDHLKQVEEQLSREPRALPELVINPGQIFTNINEYWFEDFEVVGYDPHAAIKGNVSV
jgi:thymidylate synthase